MHIAGMIINVLFVAYACFFYRAKKFGKVFDFLTHNVVMR